jgi:RimJ/RimL family protein N-acetyltransferase
MLNEWISAERLVLRRPEAADLPTLFERYAADPEVTRYLSWAHAPQPGGHAGLPAFLRCRLGRLGRRPAA